jgi:hypothetical protein
VGSCPITEFARRTFYELLRKQRSHGCANRRWIIGIAIWPEGKARPLRLPEQFGLWFPNYPVTLPTRRQSIARCAPVAARSEESNSAGEPRRCLVVQKLASDRDKADATVECPEPRSCGVDGRVSSQNDWTAQKDQEKALRGCVFEGARNVTNAFDYVQSAERSTVRGLERSKS